VLRVPTVLMVLDRGVTDCQEEAPPNLNAHRKCLRFDFHERMLAYDLSHMLAVHELAVEDMQSRTFSTPARVALGVSQPFRALHAPHSLTFAVA